MRTIAIAIANQKGGVGKTTTALAVAHRLTRPPYNRTVVLIDMDAQGNCASALGMTPQPGLYEVLKRRPANEQPPLDKWLLDTKRENLWLIPGNADTAVLKGELAGDPYGVGRLARLLNSLEACDYVILDCGPSRDMIHDMAHHAADLVVIPAMLDHLALIGVTQELETLDAVRKNGDHKIELVAILPTFYDRVTTESRLNLQTLVDTYGAPPVMPAVPRTARLREAPAFGKTLWEYVRPEDGQSAIDALDAYERLVRKIVEAS